jgi:hypothetical protein
MSRMRYRLWMKSTPMDTREDIMRNRARASRLIGVANELLAIAHDLENAVASEQGQPVSIASARRGASTREGPAEDHPLWGELARQAYADRRRRTKIFANEDLFGEPAWDILLDLFIAEKERRRVSVTSACIGSAVPSTTALRWIALLEREDLLLREADTSDARRIYVKLTTRGYAAMVDYFSQVSRSVVLNSPRHEAAAGA